MKRNHVLARFVRIAVGLSLLAWSGISVGAAGEPEAERGVRLLDRTGSQPEVALLDDFGASSAGEWKLESGIEMQLTYAARLEGDGREYLRVESVRNTPQSREAPRSWFRLSRTLKSNPEFAGAEGLRILLGLRKPGKWWLTLSIRCEDGTQYEGTLLPYEYTESALVDRIVRFQDMAKDGRKPDPARITRISIGGSAPDNVLYVDKISLFRSAQSAGWLSAVTSAPQLNLFERGGRVKLTFTVNGELPAQAAGFRYLLRDELGNAQGEGRMEILRGQQNYEADLGCPAVGYYEISTRWTNAQGQDLSEESCLKTTGSLPGGFLPFAVLGNTAAESRDLFRRYRQNAFLGLHGDRFGLCDLLGLSWRNEYWKWPWIEGKQPDRGENPEGTAGWAKKMLDTPPAHPEAIGNRWPDYRTHLSSLRANIGEETPDWARKPDFAKSPAPAYRDWNAFLNLFRDTIRVEMARYPSLSPRLYDVAWEINLNLGKGSFQKPEYGFDDVVDLYRRAASVLTQTDPAGMLIGPCYSSVLTGNALESHEELFKRGLLQYLGAINCHAYHTPPPEREEIPEKIRKFNQLVAKYNNGKTMPVYCSEMGYRSRYGSLSRHREQAEWLVRAALIFKGEGWKAFLPFYVQDSSVEHTEGSYGVMFNPDAGKNPWSPSHLLPKPAAPALATFAHVLEGTVPVQDLRFFGGDLWGYVFRRGEEAIVVAWTVEGERKIRLPAGAAKAAIVCDLYGRRRTQPVQDNLLALTLSPAPQYIIGLDAEWYLARTAATADASAATAPAPVRLYTGQKQEISLPLPAGAKLHKLEVCGRISATISGDQRITLAVPADESCGPEALRAEYRTAENQPGRTFLWMVVEPSVRIAEFALSPAGGEVGMTLELENAGALPKQVRVGMNVDGGLRQEPERTLTPGEKWRTKLPLPVGKTPDPLKTMDLTLSVGTQGEPPVTRREVVNFLAATRRGAAGNSPLPASAQITGTGSSGKVDRANLAFSWDESHLYLTLENQDDQFRQTKSGPNFWQEDSVQIAIDTHPEKTDRYNPLGSIFTKRISELGFALTPSGPAGRRFSSFDVNRLAEDDISAAVKPVIVRDEATRTTRYELALAWSELGMEPEWVHPGKVLGIAVLFNDVDAEGSPRQGLEFFSGIMHNKSEKMYGRLTLQ